MIIDGAKIAKKITDSIKVNNTQKKLAIILASDDESSKVYVNLKMKKAKELGIQAELFNFDINSDIGDIVEKIDQLNNDNNVGGILIQLPLFPHLQKDTKFIINSLFATKDVDGLTAVQQAKSSHFLPKAIPPAAVEAVLECLNDIYEDDLSWSNILNNYNNIETFRGKIITIVNNTNLLGKPLSQILSSLGATVIVANEFTKQLSDCTINSDIIISGTGQTNLIDASMVKEGSVLIDVTSSKTDKGIQGDFVIDDELKSKVKAYTPVPGGVGPITVACLLRNIAQTA